MEIKLPLNFKPYLKTYVHHAYTNAISSASDKVVNEKTEAAIVEVIKFKNNVWNCYNDDLRVDVRNEEELHFFTNRWNQNMNMVFTRECKQNDEIEIIIKKQIFSHSFGGIKLFIGNIKPEMFNDTSRINEIDYGFVLGNYCKDGIYISKKLYEHEKIYEEPHGDIYLKLSKRKNKIFAGFKNGDSEVNNILLGEIMEETVKTIGFAVSLGNNKYFENLFSKYVNLQFRTDNELALDFICNPIKNFYAYTYDYFININEDKQNKIEDLGIPFEIYIQEQIKNGRYIELPINQNLDSPEKPNYFHNDLIYGFNDKDHYFHIMYYNDGQLKKGTISYEDFFSQGNSYYNRVVYTLIYNSPYENISFNKQLLLQLFSEYKDGINLSFPAGVYDNKNIIIGIKIFDYLITEEAIDKINNDIRISHLLYEHTHINKERVEFLYYKRLISEKDFIFLVKLAEEEEDCTMIMRNAIMKHIIKNDFSDCKTKIHIEKIRELEICFVERMLYVLNR